MHGKASTSPGTKWSSNLTIFFVGVLWHGHLARSAKNIHVPTYIAWSQKMLWALNCCHIIIYHLWCGYAYSCFCYVIPFLNFLSFKHCPWLFTYQFQLSRDLHMSILEGRFPEYVFIKPKFVWTATENFHGGNNVILCHPVDSCEDSWGCRFVLLFLSYHTRSQSCS